MYNLKTIKQFNNMTIIYGNVINYSEIKNNINNKTMC